MDNKISDIAKKFLRNLKRPVGQDSIDENAKIKEDIDLANPGNDITEEEIVNYLNGAYEKDLTATRIQFRTTTLAILNEYFSFFSFEKFCNNNNKDVNTLMGLDFENFRIIKSGNKTERLEELRSYYKKWLEKENEEIKNNSVDSKNDKNNISSTDTRFNVRHISAGKEEEITPKRKELKEEIREEPEEAEKIYDGYFRNNILITSTQMFKPVKNESDKDLIATYEFYCFKGVNKKPEYEAIIKKSKDKLEEIKSKLENAKAKGDYKEVATINQAIEKLNTEIRNTYSKPTAIPSIHSGFQIVRRDGKNNPTDLPTVAEKIEIKTQGLEIPDTIRIQFSNNLFLEFYPNEKGEIVFDEQNPSKFVKFLTYKAFRSTQSFQEINNSNLLSEDYSSLEIGGRVKKLLINGTDVVASIRKSIESQKKSKLKANPLGGCDTLKLDLKPDKKPDKKTNIIDFGRS